MMTSTLEAYAKDMSNHSKAEVDRFYRQYKGAIVLTPYALSCGYIDIHRIKDYRLEVVYEGECYYLYIYDNADTCILRECSGYQYAYASRRYSDMYKKFHEYRLHLTSIQ